MSPVAKTGRCLFFRGFKPLSSLPLSPARAAPPTGCGGSVVEAPAWCDDGGVGVLLLPPPSMASDGSEDDGVDVPVPPSSSPMASGDDGGSASGPSDGSHQRRW